MVNDILTVELALTIAGEIALLFVVIALILVAASSALQDTSE